ncbi:hypothetical protein [Baekduia soli]|uniref:hypothetical protein n=1 Tax=Baekduia soli TaxID=496014 RepID=UPI0038992EF3
MNGRSWEHWVQRYERRGLTVLAPSWPGMDGDVEALRADTAPTPSTKRPRRRSRSSRSSRGARTSPWARRAGRRSPTTRSTGR